MAGAGPDPRFTYSNIDRFPDGRIFNPTCLRNNPPMVARLARLLDGRRGPVLEIGAGTGQHAAAFGQRSANLEDVHFLVDDLGHRQGGGQVKII